VNLGELTVPSTTGEVQVVIARRTELLSQMRTGEARKATLLARMRETSQGSDPAIAEQLRVVNEGVVKLEGELAITSWQLANTPPALLPSSGWRLAGSQPPPQAPFGVLSSDQIESISLAAIFFVGFPIAVAIAIKILRRSPQARSSKRELDATQHKKRMEHAVDAMAMEVERISEGQRFLTQLLAQEPRQHASLSGFDAEAHSRLRTPGDS
jgi:hypothetical protein